MLILEGLVLSFWLLLVCTVGISEGPVGLVSLYEQEVQDRVVELELTTHEKIKRNGKRAALAIFIPDFTIVPAAVWLYNGVDGFLDGFTQLTVIYLIAALFDRLFIDEFWVGHTSAWDIEGTEDLKPYIPSKTKIIKWCGSLIGFPILAAIISGVAMLI